MWYTSRPFLIGAGTLVLILAILAMVSCIRRDAYNDGVEATDAEWNKATQEVLNKAENSADNADINAAARANQFVEQLGREKEAVDDAVQNGTDPFGGLFPIRLR